MFFVVLTFVVVVAGVVVVVVVRVVVVVAHLIDFVAVFGDVGAVAVLVLVVVIVQRQQRPQHHVCEKSHGQSSRLRAVPLTSPLAEPRGCSLLGKNRACGALADPGYPLAGACDCASDSTRRTFFADSGCSVLASKLAGD